MREIEYREAIREALDEEMQRDPDIFLIGEDIGIYASSFRETKGLFEKYGPDRVIDTPISESAIIGAGIGAALTGSRPVVSIMFIDFMMLAMDQIINQAAKIRFMSGKKLKIPMVIRTQGGYGTGMAAQHSQSLEALFYHIPGLKIVVPATPYDVKGLLKAAIRDEEPVLFIEHKLLYLNKGPVPEEEYTIPLGTADIKRKGTDVTIIAYSRMIFESLKAAEELAEERGISCEVIDLRSLNPLDENMILESVKKTGRIISVSEGCKKGSVASDIGSMVTEKSFDCLDAPVKIIAGLNTPIPYNTNLGIACIPSKDDIKKAINEII
jgi:acetoin:2,6-dichlorophenolindophenol oxidoreductase subunit beta